MKKILLFTLSLSFIFAQIQQGGTPKFFNAQIDRVEFESIASSSIIDRNFDPMVFQFGREYDVDISIIDEAMVIVDDNIYTFLYAISSPGAYGLGFNFSDFYLTPNAELYFYDEERTEYFGALTHFNNKEVEQLTTSIIKGSNIVMELSVPLEEIDDIRLYLDTVIHDFTDIMNYYNTLNSDREDCNINVICPEGDDWRDQINGVLRVSMEGWVMFCLTYK